MKATSLVAAALLGFFAHRAAAAPPARDKREAKDDRFSEL